MKRRVMMMLAAVSALAACGMFGGGSKETSVEMTLAAGNQLNPNAQRRPSPVVVRVFDLKTPAGFDAATYEGLFERDRETLAADLVARDEFTLNAGEGKRIERKLAPETKVIAVAVAFRELERAAWRTTVAVKPNTKNRINVALDGVTVIATVVP
ncbi:MAG TPA: type VI secretion system lipoprotein TssJ [Burkholderiaceae bacterium]|jgi:type VI secretion system protein VasD|nr:type VI secretion system lipoprotein TssJ [Burkholderiaceae bacterium]